MIANILLGVSGLILLILCLGVFLSNPKRSVNLSLAAFLFSGFLWLLANLLTNLSTGQNTLFFTRSTLVGAALIPLTFLVFAETFTGYRRPTASHLLKLAFLPALVILFTPTRWNISSVQANGHNAVAGPVYFALLLILIFYFSYGVMLLYNYQKKAPVLEKAQLQYIFAGLLLTFIPAFITNGILPLFGSSDASAYGPIAVMGVSVFTTIAIVKHQLLDIRFIVARSLAYVLLIISLIFLLSASLFGLSALFFTGQTITLGVKVSYILTALALAFILQPLKRFFDQLTNNLFYRDAYDPQQLLDELNAKLVATIEIRELAQGSAVIVKSHMKIDHCSFLIKTPKTENIRVFNDKELDIDKEQVGEIYHSLHLLKGRVLISSDLDRQSHLAQLLQKNSIMAVAKLHTNTEAIGFMMLGYKKSGSIYSKQDVRILDIISDQLAIAIQNSLRFEEIEQFNLTLQARVDEATVKLRHANTKLKELDSTKDEFISMASHQLRTPLTTIKGYLSMILDGDAGEVKKGQQEMIQQAFDSASRMVYLIADLLNVSRLQSGKFIITNKPTDLDKVIKGEVAQLREQATNRKINLQYQPPSEATPMLNLDEDKIRQVIMNFLDNGLYYTPAGGTVIAMLAVTQTEVSFSVTDTGVGVPKSVQHHLFSKFYRADNARKMRPDGTGLGLYMAKKVIAAQGGALTFRSIEGKGSTFGFSLPRGATEVKQ